MNKQGKYIEAIAGHFLDCIDMLRFKATNPRSLSKLRQILAVKKRTKSVEFIETGTYLGNTAYRSSWFFGKVYTVEIDKELFGKASRYLKKRENVHCYLGDALDVLGEIFTENEIERALVFLDGHFSGGETGHGEEVEPACLEIEVLKPYISRIGAVVVDDFRTFTGRNGFPSKAQLLSAIESTFADDFSISINYDQVLIERKTNG